MDDITYADYKHAKNIQKNFEIKNLGEYHNLYVQSLLIADVFENFRSKCIEIYELELFFICTRISMKSMFKKDKSRTRIINKKNQRRNMLCNTIIQS